MLEVSCQTALCALEYNSWVERSCGTVRFKATIYIYGVLATVFLTMTFGDFFSKYFLNKLFGWIVLFFLSCLNTKK